jgi:molybdate transport system regulatory protein
MKATYEIKNKLWIEYDNRILLGEGRVELLKAIKTQGSLSKAAKVLSLSYKKAWRLLDQINEHAKEPVVIRTVGGKNGGGTKVTEYGEKLIRIFEVLKEDQKQFLAAQIIQLEKL